MIAKIEVNLPPQTLPNILIDIKRQTPAISTSIQSQHPIYLSYLPFYLLLN